MSRYNLKSYRVNSSVVIWLSDYKCGMLGCSGNYSEVHHIDKNLDNNCVQNLIPLCYAHHKFVHIASVNYSFWPKKLLVLLLAKVSPFTKAIQNKQ